MVIIMIIVVPIVVIMMAVVMPGMTAARMAGMSAPWMARTGMSGAGAVIISTSAVLVSLFVGRVFDAKIDRLLRPALAAGIHLIQRTPPGGIVV